MKTQIINNQGYAWDFENLTEAKKYIKKDRRNDYVIIEGVAIYDDRTKP